MQGSTRRFYVLLGVVTLLGLAVRLAYVVGVKWDQNLWGDAFSYHFAANGIADGFGFATWVPKSFTNPHHIILSEPSSWHGIVSVGASADNPPLFPLYLAGFSVVGLRTFHDHMIASVLLGTSSVFMMGLVGRKIAGARVGILAALIAALYGNFWVNDSVVTSETMGILGAAIVVLLAYRAWEAPSRSRVIILGLACGAAALIRSEFVLLGPMLLIPLVVRRLGGHSIKERVGVIAMAAVAALLVMSPWLIRNLTIFERPELLSTDAGLSLAATNCGATYDGVALGWWSPKCIVNVQAEGDPSEQDAFWRKRGLHYISHHLDRYPVVLAARLGRMWELYHPGSPWGEIRGNQKIAFDITEGRSEVAARLALAQFYVLVPLAIGGAFVLRRRGVTIAPLVALPIVASITAMYAFGNTRYRIIAEVAIAALAAVAVDALLSRSWARYRGVSADASVDAQ